MRKAFQNIAAGKNGFTLIELLIVIAIIGILTTIITANFVGVRQRARDAQRKSDMRQIQSALELYRSDNGIYPIKTSTPRLNATSCPTSSSLELNGTTYMKEVPCDPSGSGSGSYYAGNYFYYSEDGITYELIGCIENRNDQDANIVSQEPTHSSGTCATDKYFVVTDP